MGEDLGKPAMHVSYRPVFLVAFSGNKHYSKLKSAQNGLEPCVASQGDASASDPETSGPSAGAAVDEAVGVAGIPTGLSLV